LLILVGVAFYQIGEVGAIRLSYGNLKKKQSLRFRYVKEWDAREGKCGLEKKSPGMALFGHIVNRYPDMGVGGGISFTGIYYSAVC
jgi:hypothetical protein